MLLFQVRTGFGGAALSPPSRPWKGPKPARSPRLPRWLMFQPAGSGHQGPARLCACPGGPAPELTFRGAGTPWVSPCCFHMAPMVCAWVPATGLSGQGDVSPHHLGERGGWEEPRIQGRCGVGRAEQELSLIQPCLPRFQPPLRPLPACHPGSLLTPSALLPTTIPHGRQTRAPGTRGPALSGPWVTSLKLHLSKSCHPTTE